MNDFAPEMMMLRRILVEKKSFQESYFMAKVNERLSSLGKERLKSRTLGVLRHYQSLSFEVGEIASSVKKDSDIYLLLLIALYVIRHEKTDIESVKKMFFLTFERLRIYGNSEETWEEVKNEATKPFTIPQEVKNSPYIYNSLQLEIPAFLLKKLSKNRTGKEAVRIALSLRGKAYHYYGVVSGGKAKDNRLEEIDLGAWKIYKSEKRLTISECNELGLYPVSFTEQACFSQIDNESISPKVLMNGCQDALTYVTISKLYSDMFESEIYPVYYDAVSFRLAKDVNKKYSLNNSHIMLADSKMIKTYLDMFSFDLVFSFNQDSKIGLSRMKPEIVPTVSEKTVSESVKKEYETLVDSSMFVKPNGKLVFFNNSLLADECDDVINMFLKKNRDFVVLKDEYIFPYSNDAEGGYYAIMRKIK